MYKTLLFKWNGTELISAYVSSITLDEQLNSFSTDRPERELVTIVAVPDGAVVVVRDIHLGDAPDWSNR